MRTDLRRLLTPHEKRRILLYLMGLDEGQRLAQELLRVNRSDEARKAYLTARSRMLYAEQLHRQALAGNSSALLLLLKTAPLGT